MHTKEGRQLLVSKSIICIRQIDGCLVLGVVVEEILEFRNLLLDQGLEGHHALLAKEGIQGFPSSTMEIMADCGPSCFRKFKGSDEKGILFSFARGWRVDLIKKFRIVDVNFFRSNSYNRSCMHKLPVLDTNDMRQQIRSPYTYRI